MENKNATQPSSVWDKNYAYATQFYLENGHLIVPTSYVTEDGMQLGLWIQKQRTRYRYKDETPFSDIEIQKLNNIGMIWDITEYNWQNNYCFAKQFFEQNHHLKIPYNYETNGLSLGKWIHTQRKAYKNQGNCKISYEHIEQLEQIGMIWDYTELIWEENLQKLQVLYKKYGEINIPSSYVSEDGTKLGFWLWSIKKDYLNGKLTNKQIQELEKLNIYWEGTKKKITSATIDNWIKEQDDISKNHPISLTTKQLASIRQNNGANTIIQKSHTWDECLNIAQKVLQKEGNIPHSFVVDNKIDIGKWFYTQEKLYKVGQMSPQRKNQFMYLLRNKNGRYNKKR